MFNEKNIPKFISYLPSLGIILVTAIFTLLIIKNDYATLAYENQQIRVSHIKEEKLLLKKTINEVIQYKNYLENYNINETENKTKIQEDVIGFIKDVIPKHRNYILIMDNKANIIHHPDIKRDTNTWELKDTNGFLITQTFIKESLKNKEGTFIDYYWNKPHESKAKKKTSYVYYLKDWNWIIATGTYLDDIEKKILIKTDIANKKISQNISYTLIISIILTILTLLISFLFSRSINKIFSNYKIDAVLKEKKLKKLNRSLKKLANEEIKKRSQKEKELEFAHIERLTGLPNRLKLSEILTKAKNPKLAILNIDRFIDINNFYSPKLSDELLKEIAKLLVNSFKNKKDIKIFKLPVDEYAIFTDSSSLSDFEFKNFCSY